MEEDLTLKIHTKAVHAGDRRKAGPHIPVTTPIYTAASFYYDTTERLDSIFAHAEPGFCYSRWDNPTTAALEELVTALESGHGTLACSSGMAALHIALQAALTDRRQSVLAAHALYGASINLLLKIFAPLGAEVDFVDIFDLAAVEEALARQRPACLLIETISNPLLRVPALDRLAEMARAHDTTLLVDNTFATPLLVRPLELGAQLVVHSATKYLGGHGDVLGGLVVSDDRHYETLRAISRASGPVLGPFESYLTMRGIKTFALRMERQCANAFRLADWLASHPRVEAVYFPGGPKHPDADVISRLLPDGLRGAMVSFELRDATRESIFAFMDRLKMIVRATSLGDVHTMILYPVMSSHRELAPKQRERMGVKENLLRLSVGIEDAADIIADLEQALSVFT